MSNEQFYYSTVGANNLMCGHYRESRGYVTVDRGHHSYWILIHTLGGRGRFSYPGGATYVTAGDTVLLQPDSPRDQGTADEPGTWDLAWAHFQPRSHWLDWMNWPNVAPGLLCVRRSTDEISAEIERALIEMNRLAQRSDSSRYALVMNALERAILWAGGAGNEGRVDERIRRVMDYVLADIGRRVSTNELAAVACLSPSRFAHLFHEQTSTTPAKFIEEERLAQASEQLLMTDRKIGAIAADLGFNSIFYFSRRFRQHTGRSPSSYRAERGKILG